MSVNITAAFVNQYGTNVRHLAQQKTSLLENCVRRETVNSDKDFFERLGKTAAVRKTVRHGDTPLVNSDHSRRMLTVADYEWADLVDKEDKIRLLISPESDYAKSAVAALNRTKDDVIIAAFAGTAYSGVDGTTAVSFPAGQEIAHGGGSITLAKVLEAKKKLDQSDVDPSEARYILCSPRHLHDFLNVTEVKSADYNSIKALVSGAIDTYLGFKWIVTNRTLTSPTAGTYSGVYAWCQSAIVLGMGADIKTRIDERADKSYAVQVYASLSCGATRIEDELVVRIDTNVTT
jgi:hypothetical protein